MSKAKKQVPLRLSQELYNDLNTWAKDDFRSLNGQIEYLLTACVKSRKKTGRPVPKSFDPLEEVPEEGDGPEDT